MADQELVKPVWPDFRRDPNTALVDRLHRAIGIDLSLTATGIARCDGACVLLGEAKLTTMSWSRRIAMLNGLAQEIVGTATIVNPRWAVIEGLDMAQSYGGQIERSYLWCQVVQELEFHGCQVFVAPSPQLKMYATGKGSGPKQAVIEAVHQQWPHFNCGKNDNLADASVLAAIGRDLAGLPFTQVSPAQKKALEKVVSILVPPTPKPRKPRRLTQEASH